MVTLKKTQPLQTTLEEVFNATTHGIGIILSIAALVLLVVFSAIQGHTISVVSTAVYGATLIILYLASTLYHAIPHERIKAWLKVFDHISIYLLIAGTYTPFTLVTMRGAWGWSLFGVIWGLAVAGIVFKIFFTGKYEVVSVALYLLMGWMVLVAFKPLIHALPLGGLVWLALGGFCYTLGVVFYMTDHKYHLGHFAWHLLVLTGSICHFFAILFYVVY